MKAILYTLLLCIPFIGQSADYYWIGGSGNWSDISHWATTSGGNVTHAVVPSSSDNVIFDNNSFTADGQIVTFNNELVFFGSLDATANTRNITIRGAENIQIMAYGSILLGDNVTFNFDGSIVCTGDGADNRLDFGSNRAGDEFYIASGGTWQMDDLIVVDSIFQLDRGTLVTNGHDIRTLQFFITTDGEKNISLGDSEILILGKYGKRRFYNELFDTISASIHTTNLTWDAGTSTFVFTGNPTELRLTGDRDLRFHNLHFDNSFGRCRIRMFVENQPDGTHDDIDLTFNELRLDGSADIQGDVEINDLIISAPKIYTFESGKNVRINNIEDNGDCARNTIITSSRAGVPFNLISSSAIGLSFITLRGVNASGGGSFTANQSTDLGNNNGWTFADSDPTEFFWIGGSGSWTDPAHWSFTSGGASSGCVPTGKDIARFDANSFTGGGQSVLLNIQDVFIGDMFWEGVTGNPALRGAYRNRLHVTRSLRLDAGMDHAFRGSYFFESNRNDNTITTSGNKLLQDAKFAGTTARWTIQDDFNVAREMIHESGEIVSRNNEMEIWRYLSRINSSRLLDIEGSYITLRDFVDSTGRVEGPSDWFVATDNYELKAENSTIEFTCTWYNTFTNTNANQVEYNNIIFNAVFGLRSYGGEETNNVKIDSTFMNVSGSTGGQTDFNYLYLAPGFEYEFQEYQTQSVNILDANGTCDGGLVIIGSSDNGVEFTIDLISDHTLERIDIQDAIITSSSITAESSLDNGNNTNIVFTELEPRTLYWVHDNGDWHNPVNWSLASGGAGGECIPTAIDDVVFDVNSFTTNNEMVSSRFWKTAIFHTMTWTDDVFGNPEIGYKRSDDEDWRIDKFRCYGSLRFTENMRNDVYWTEFFTRENDSVITNGQLLEGITIRTKGDIRFIDDLTTWSMNHTRGSATYDDINIRAQYYTLHTNRESEPLDIDYGSSTFHFDRSINSRCEYNNTAVFNSFNAKASKFLFKSNQNEMAVYRDLEYGAVELTNAAGMISVGDRTSFRRKPDDSERFNIRSLRMAGDGLLYGEMTFDTLVGAPGKTYTLESNETQEVNQYLQLIGNNCTPIQLNATSSGTQGIFRMPASSEIVANFVEMSDNRGIGGADFNAGARSNDVSNNTGWTFEDPPDYVETGFLGVDRALCNDVDLVLDAYNYSPNEIYQWSDGSSDTTLLITETGTYNATVTFGNGCQIIDEIIVKEAEDIVVDLPQDTIICEGTELALDGNIGLQGTKYKWQDDVLTSDRTVSEEGLYVLSAEIEGCIAKDSIQVDVQVTPVIDLGAERAICDGDAATLDATFDDGATYQWSSGQTTPTINAKTEGLYWAEVEINNCSFRDSVTLAVSNYPTVELSGDTTLCEGQVLNLSIITEDGVTYTWQDGTTGSSYDISVGGLYKLTGNNMGCIREDSLNVNFQEAPDLDLGENIEGCEGDVVQLSSGITADAFSWNTGETNGDIDVDESGTFTVMATVDKCTLTDSVVVTLFTYPTVDLGEDQSICEGEAVTLSADNQSGIWQDGSEQASFSASQEGMYRLIVSNNGCETRDSMQLEVRPLPAVSFEDTEETICEDESFTLSAPSGLQSYSWYDGGSESIKEITKDGLYWIEAELDNCFNRDTFFLNVNPLPSIAFATDTVEACSDIGALLEPTLSLGNVLWSDGSAGPSLQVSESGMYIAEIDLNGCFAMDSIEVQLVKCSYFDAFMANIFNPSSGQEGNQTFGPVFKEDVEILNYQMHIFDRWGNSVFSSNDKDLRWDGRHGGKPAMPGVYVYDLTVSYRDDREEGDKRIKGNITLIR